MRTRFIKSDKDYEEAMREIEMVWGAPDATMAGGRLDELVSLVEAFEQDRWPEQRQPHETYSSNGSLRNSGQLQNLS